MDYAIIYIYLAGILLLGLYGKQANSKSFLFAGRNLTIPAFVMTLVSTWYGGILEIGRFSHQNGISTWLVFGLFYYIAALVYARYIARHIPSSKNDSIPSRFYTYYGRHSAILAVLLVFLLSSPAPYLKMLANMLSYILNIKTSSALILGITCSTLYTLRGGFSAIVKTDIIQFILMFAGFGYMAIYLYLNFGGFNFLYTNLDPHMLSFPGKLNWTYIFTWSFIALITFIDPSFYQRIYSTNSTPTATKGIYISILFWFLFDILSITVGLYSAAIIPSLEFSPYIDIAEYVLPPVIKGAFIVSLLAIIMSTIDSFIFISGFTIGKDLTMILKNKNNSISYVKAGIIISGLFSAILASFFTHAVDIWYTVGSFAVPALLIPLLYTYFNIGLKHSFVCMCMPIIITSIWFIYGYTHPNGYGYPIYPYNLDPMYPGILISGILCFINKRIIS